MSQSSYVETAQGVDCLVECITVGVFEQLIVQILLSHRASVFARAQPRGRTDAAWGHPRAVRAATCTSACIHVVCGSVAEQHAKIGGTRCLTLVRLTASKIEVEGEHG